MPNFYTTISFLKVGRVALCRAPSFMKSITDLRTVTSSKFKFNDKADNNSKLVYNIIYFKEIMET